MNRRAFLKLAEALLGPSPAYDAARSAIRLWSSGDGDTVATGHIKTGNSGLLLQWGEIGPDGSAILPRAMRVLAYQARRGDEDSAVPLLCDLERVYSTPGSLWMAVGAEVAEKSSAKAEKAVGEY